MTVAIDEFDAHSREWYRLNAIALKYESKMRLAYTRAAINGLQIDTLQLKKVIIDILVEVCTTSAAVYGVVFNPASAIYSKVVDELVEKFVRTIYSPTAKDAVRAILPPGLGLTDRHARLNTFGLTPRQAVSVENYRQELLRSGAKGVEANVERVRRSEIQNRGNNISITEVNRIVNTSLETLFLDNFNKTAVVHKAKRRVVVKRIVTRRDNRVCNYCSPLDGITVNLGAEFDTKYGLYQGPPFHPKCRCFMAIETPDGQLFSARRKVTK